MNSLGKRFTRASCPFFGSVKIQTVKLIVLSLQKINDIQESISHYLPLNIASFMKHLWKLVLIGTLLLSFENHAQSNKQQQLIDSLQTILQTTLPSTLHIQALNELAWIYRNNDYSKSYNFGIKAKNLAIQLKDNKGLATAYNRIGLVSQYQGNYTKALTFFEEALKIEKKSAHTYGIARSYNQIGSVQILNKNYSTAIKSFNLS